MIMIGSLWIVVSKIVESVQIVSDTYLGIVRSTRGEIPILMMSPVMSREFLVW